MRFTRNDPDLKDKRRSLRKAQTEAEKKLWQRIRAKQFYGIKFYRQYSVGTYILDFYCSSHKLGIELDGGQHAEEQNLEYDEKRSVYLKKQDINVIRFWNIDVFQNIEGVLEEIKKQITPPAPS